MNRGTRDTICATIGLLIVIALLTTVAALDSPGEMDEPNALSSAAPEPRVEMPEDSLPAEEYAYCNDVCLGLFELTAYCPCSACCGKNDGITATGTVATEGRTVAVDPTVIPYGTSIEVIYADGSSIKRLTGRIPLDEDKTDTRTRACIEFSVRGTPKDRVAMQEGLMKLASELEMDFSFQQDNMYRRMRRLICFDMDSTLIETEVIDELAIRAGVGDQVKAITESAMRGEIDFTESFTRRVALLKGLDESVMQEIAESLPITEGVDRLMYVLKKYGYKIAILSGGFTYFGQYLQKKYGIDYVYANELEIVDGKLTGRYLGDVVDGKRKAELLRLIAQVEKVDIAQTIAVGDGANDLPMLGIAGLGIAFHAKPKVVANAKQSINTIGLDGVLYFLGFKDSYLNM